MEEIGTLSTYDDNDKKMLRINCIKIYEKVDLLFL